MHLVFTTSNDKLSGISNAKLPHNDGLYLMLWAKINCSFTWFVQIISSKQQEQKRRHHYPILVTYVLVQKRFQICREKGTQQACRNFWIIYELCKEVPGASTMLYITIHFWRLSDLRLNDRPRNNGQWPTLSLMKWVGTAELNCDFNRSV